MIGVAWGYYCVEDGYCDGVCWCGWVRVDSCEDEEVAAKFVEGIDRRKGTVF